MLSNDRDIPIRAAIDRYLSVCGQIATALRGHTPADYKFADALWTKAASPRDDIVRPASERIVGKTNVR